jgi:hypothetical protein
MQNKSRIDAECVTLNAVREVVKIAAKGDAAKATYDNPYALIRVQAKRQGRPSNLSCLKSPPQR